MPLAIGAVVDGVPTTCHTPLSGQASPVRAVVPIGTGIVKVSLMSKFGLVKSFAIDNGELDSLSAQQCFVLGYELAQIDQLLTTGEGIHRPVNADNRDRIESACRDASRDFKLTWLPGDESESWLLLEVMPK